MMRYLALGLTVAVMPAACGSSTGGPDAGSPVISVEVAELCSSYTTKMTSLLSTCMNVPSSTANAYMTSMMVLSCGPILSKEVLSGRVKIDHGQVQPCLDAMSCDSIGSSAPDACSRVTVGQVADGGACYEDSDCQHGGDCSFASNACPGRCVEPIPLGGPCTGLESPGCVTGSSCVPNAAGTRATCTATVGLNSPCLIDEQDAPLPACDSKTSCVTDGTSPARCVARVDGDQACSTQDPYAPLDIPECTLGLQCTSGKCVRTSAAMGNKKVGDACAAGRGECIFGLATCKDSVCALLPVAGEPCATLSSPYEGTCLLGTVCDATSHKCRSAGIDQPCTAATDCSLALACTSGKCALRPDSCPAP